MAMTDEVQAPPTASRLRVEDVSVRFGGVAALDGVTIDVRPGEVRGLIGPNGAGKTTLFDVITGMCAPTTGRVLLDGDDISRRSAVWRSRHALRRTFQRQQPFGWLTVEENLLAATDWRATPGQATADFLGLPSSRRGLAARRERAGEVMERCSITDIAQRPAGTLAIGQARMLELARAIIDDPALLLLDEPTSGLEDEQAEALAAIVRVLVAETSCSVMVVEHDVSFVMGLCDQVSVLNLGRLIADGPPAEVSADPVVREVYLG